jgi:hypothetical protein
MSSQPKGVVKVAAVETYEAWISESAGSIRVKVVELDATSEQDAFRKARELCTGTEFVRGVMVTYAEDDADA